MTLLSGTALVHSRFFAAGTLPAIERASSYDLTVGRIISHEGTDLGDHFVLPPNATVLVVSEQIFALQGDVTGHVTYKTGMTQRGVWALTVGIVDPWWDGPVTTTLLNFSQEDFLISKGDAFLRVSFFKHASVQPPAAAPSGGAPPYLMRMRAAAIRFPKTFLNQDKLALAAGEEAAKLIKDRAVFWFSVIGAAFLLVSLAAPLTVLGLDKIWPEKATASNEVSELRAEVRALRALVLSNDGSRSSASPPIVAETKGTQARQGGNQ